MRFLVSIFVLGALSAGCSPTKAVIKQASFDFACPAEKIQVQHLATYSYGATGCDKRASYMAGCGIFGCHVLANGAWVR